MTDPTDATEHEPEGRPDGRPDPRLRPPDPAGTQPKWDPDDLLPKALPPAASGRLWAPADVDGDEDDDDRRSSRDTEVVTARVAAEGAGAVTAADAEPVRSRYSPRFHFLFGALIAVGAAAIVLLVAVIVGGGKSDRTITLHTGPAWSSWHPGVSGTADGPTEIAEHVGKEYKLPDGHQLVAVTGGPLEIAGLPITVAIRKTVAQGGDIELVQDGAGVLYRMCGLGPKCSIATGKASQSRHLLLRREALELALYSFRYLGVSEAVVFLPPRKGEDPSQAVFFRRGERDLATAVAQPLTATLARHTPSVSTVTRSPDARMVQTITTSKLFSFSFTQANQDARAFLVLDPLQ